MKDTHLKHNYSKIFPNSHATNILGCEIWKDPNGETIGWTCEDGIFRLRKDYEYAYEAYYALMEFDTEIIIET